MKDLQFMSESHLLHFFGGKGGSGKTTLSAAYAVALSESNPKDRILLVSADPTQSMGDLFKKKLSAEPTKVVTGKGHGGLSVAELDSASAFSPFLEKYRPALQRAVGKGAVLAESELQAFVQHSLLGIEDWVSWLSLVELLDQGTFDKIILDTPPHSHALRVFDAPAAIRKLCAAIRGDRKAKKEGEPEGELDQLLGLADKWSTFVKDAARCTFHLVALGEPVPEVQTRHYFAQLKERGIPVSEIIVNQVEDKTGCPACLGRRGLQAPHVRKFQQLDKTLPVHLFSKREAAPRGLDVLKKLAKDGLWAKETKPLEFAVSEGPPALVRAPSMPPIAAPPLPPTRLIFFVGHGGVGKSSCAAAAAVTLTEKEGPVLLISADSAHSLSDVLQCRLTDNESQVKGTKGLYARELDVPGWFNGLRRRIKEKADKAFEVQKGKEGPPDRELLRQLLEVAPAGMEELGSLSVLAEALMQERFKRIVVDPAPGGKAMRLLQLPDLAKGWLAAVVEVLSKHRSSGLGELADELALLQKHIRRFEEALATPNESRFVVVTQGEELASLKTERLVELLKEKKLAVERVLVNRVLPKSSCPKCENRRKVELLAAKALEKRVGLPITVAPALGRHPAGLRELKAFRTAWYALSAPAKIQAA
jgi:arsenite-transporting ATPase